jgi:hypothetical protein
VPFESFAFPPIKVIPDIDEISAWKFQVILSPELRVKWKVRRELFLNILENAEKERTTTRSHNTSVASMMRSPRSAFANFLNLEGIVGFLSEIPKDYFLQWLVTITGEEEVEKFKSAI